MMQVRDCSAEPHASLAAPGLLNCPVEASVAAWLYKFRLEQKGDNGDELGESEYRA